MKSEHFTAYLSTYNGILAGVTGLFFGLIAYRLSDPMSPYRVIRRRTLQLATAIGGSLGILVAVMQVPPNAPDKVSLLLLAIAVGAVCTLIGSWIAFQVMRILSNRSARRDGRRLTDRMRHA
jgi:drug/metabolite transporter (DMT)-like permease